MYLQFCTVESHLRDVFSYFSTSFRFIRLLVAEIRKLGYYIDLLPQFITSPLSATVRKAELTRNE